MQDVLNALMAGAWFAGDICPRPLRTHGLARGQGSGEAETDPFARGQGSSESENDPFARGQGSGESEFCLVVRRPRANFSWAAVGRKPAYMLDNMQGFCVLLVIPQMSEFLSRAILWGTPKLGTRQ